MPGVGCQQIIFRNAQEAFDQGDILAAINRAGYDAYEGRALIGKEEAQAHKTMAESHGLVCAGFHTNIRSLEDQVDGIVEGMVEMGTRFLCNSGVLDRETTDGYKRSGDILNRAGRRLQEEGLVLCYHNHAWEFEILEDGQTRGMDLILQETDPAYVKLCVDIYWVAMGGEDPAVFVCDNWERCGYFHYKDGKEDRTFLPLGRGFVDLKAADAACREAGVEWVVVEQDRPLNAPEEDARESREYLRGLGY